MTYGAHATTATSGRQVGKIDYQWTANHSLFGRYMHTFVDELPVWEPGAGATS